MSSADSARLQMPYVETRRRARAFRSFQPKESNSKAVTYMVIGMLVVFIGCLSGYLMFENHRLRQAVNKAGGTPTPKATPPVVAPTLPPDTNETRPKPAAPNDAEKDPATKKTPEEHPTVLPVPMAPEPELLRASFPGRQGKPEDYVRGKKGHWAQSQDIWIVEVAEFKQDAKGNWDIVFLLVSVLKGDQQQHDRTLTVNSLNPWREFGLPPGDVGKGRRYVYFLRGDDSFFALKYADYEAIKKAGKL